MTLVVLTLAVISVPHDDYPPRFGALLSLTGLAALIYTMIESSTHGVTDLVTLGTCLAVIVLLGLFVWWELPCTDPTLDPRQFSVRGFAAGSPVLTVQFSAACSLLFTILQYVGGFSALLAATVMLPRPATMIPLARTVSAS